MLTWDFKAKCPRCGNVSYSSEYICKNCQKGYLRARVENKFHSFYCSVCEHIGHIQCLKCGASISDKFINASTGKRLAIVFVPIAIVAAIIVLSAYIHNNQDSRNNLSTVPTSALGVAAKKSLEENLPLWTVNTIKSLTQEDLDKYSKRLHETMRERGDVKFEDVNKMLVDETPFMYKKIQIQLNRSTWSRAESKLETHTYNTYIRIEKVNNFNANDKSANIGNCYKVDVFVDDRETTRGVRTTAYACQGKSKLVIYNHSGEVMSSSDKFPTLLRK